MFLPKNQQDTAGSAGENMSCDGYPFNMLCSTYAALVARQAGRDVSRQHFRPCCRPNGLDPHDTPQLPKLTVRYKNTSGFRNGSFHRGLDCKLLMKPPCGTESVLDAVSNVVEH